MSSFWWRKWVHEVDSCNDRREEPKSLEDCKVVINDYRQEKGSENTLEAFYDHIYNLAYTFRYSNVARIKNESVAEHSFMVASLVIKLHEYYVFNLGDATIMAISHDWPEAWVGDVTIRVKRDYPNIKAAIEVAEEDIAKKNFSFRIQLSLEELHLQNTVEAKIVRYADILQCIQYAKHEIELGNKGYMKTVLDEAIVGATKMRHKLFIYRRIGK